MNIFKATADFEHWLARQLPIIRQDLALKHQHKAEAEFPFFRATFYRWLQLWPKLCGHLAKAPAVLGVGDLHIENFGTWRDEEGRLIWGVNDLDEAWPAPYTLDLVRLTNSVYVAIGEEHLNLTKRVAAEAIRVIVTPWPPGARRLSWRKTIAGCACSPSASSATRCNSGISWSIFPRTPPSRRRKYASCWRVRFPRRGKAIY